MIFRGYYPRGLTCAVAVLLAGTCALAETAPPRPGSFRGVFFNPLVKADQPDFPWLCFYPEYRAGIQDTLRELSEKTRVNLVCIFVCIAYSLKQPAQPPPAEAPLAEWANIAFLDGVADFVDDCHDAGIAVELDLACNMWIPGSIDTAHHIGNSRYWPMPSETPWVESAAWYRNVITYIEEKAKHPENIAMWCMTGNYELGGAEPCLWDREDNPAVTSGTEQFVKNVWPAFRAAGTRPKAAPMLLPIFSNSAHWMKKPPRTRLNGFTNLKKWLVDDLAMPPDYWVMSSYPFCDPAPDGVFYLREIVHILGPENASRILSTDLKGPGHDDVRDCILSIEGRPGPEILEWHFRKCAEYGLAGWWIWAYEDTPTARSGIRGAAGEWKEDLVTVIAGEARAK